MRPRFEVTGITCIPSIELIFEFYEVYLSVTDKSKQQTFEEFATWAKTAIQDFNEIDRYLLDPNHVFSYLKDIEAITPKYKINKTDINSEFYDYGPSFFGNQIVFTSSRSEGNLYSKIHDWTKQNFTDLFVNPNEAGPITFTATIDSELGDNINFIDSSIIINCEATTIENIASLKKLVLVKVIDLLGRESDEGKNRILFHLYSDGTVEKKIIIE